MVDFKKIRTLIIKKGLEEYQDDIINEINESLDFLIKDKIKKYSNKNRVSKNDKTKETYDIKDILSGDSIEALPSWVKKDIENAHIIGESKNTIQISNGKKYNIKNKLNDLSGSEWTYFLNSVIFTRYVTSGKESYAHNIRKIHPSPKPPQLMRDIIKFFTKENDLVLDYFMGVGGTLL